jgi:predicted Zn-dependent protease
MGPKSKLIAFGLLLGWSCLAAACAHAPYTDRRQLMMIPESTEISLGNRAYEDIKKRYPLCEDPAVNELVVTVGQRLAWAAARPDFRWEFLVFQAPKEANAFCLPGGKVGIFTGLLKYTQDEAGLAAVMAHEVAHVLARHAGERMSQSMLAQMGGLGLSLGLGGVSPLAAQGIMQAYGLGSQVGVLMPFSRKQEAEADRIGLILMAKAGYDPAMGLVFWRRLMADPPPGKAGLPQFLSTHPSDINRVKAMEDFLPEARQYYHPLAPEAAPAPEASAPQVPPPTPEQFQQRPAEPKPEELEVKPLKN